MLDEKIGVWGELDRSPSTSAVCTPHRLVDQAHMSRSSVVSGTKVIHVRPLLTQWFGLARLLPTASGPFFVDDPILHLR